MKNHYIVFEDDIHDADIISIPESLSSNINKIAQEFFCWLPNAEGPLYWVVINGKKYNVGETEGFIKWLNAYYNVPGEEACIIEQHVDVLYDYPIIEF